jgi:hypothetical protein
MQEDPIQNRPAAGPDRTAVVRFVDEKWGASIEVAHGTVFGPAELSVLGVRLASVPRRAFRRWPAGSSCWPLVAAAPAYLVK